MTTYDVHRLTEALAAGARAFLGSLDGSEDTSAPFQAQVFTGPIANGERIDFDPLYDAPPVSPDPHAHRDDPANKLSSLVYLGAIARLNADEHRGANAAEISEFARKAGYKNGRVVSGWNSRPNSPRAIENIDGLRILNEGGHRWIRELADDLNINLVGDITPLPLP